MNADNLHGDERPASAGSTPSNRERLARPPAASPSEPGVVRPGERPDGAPETLRLMLFVAGASPRSNRARDALQDLATHRAERTMYDVVDVLDRPDLAEKHGVVATPLLVRVGPLPSRRIVGDLTDYRRVAEALGVDLPPASVSTTKED